MGDDQASTLIQSVVLTLLQAGIEDVPAAMRLTGLNARRNTSVHGQWTDVLDREALESAIAAARSLHAAASAYLTGRGIVLNGDAAP